MTAPATGAWPSSTRRRRRRSPRSVPPLPTRSARRSRRPRQRSSPAGATCLRASAPSCFTAWPSASATMSSPSPNSRRATSANQSATPAGRPTPGQRSSSITPVPSGIYAARRSPWRAAGSTSRCASRWASSPQSPRGISRSSSPAGRSPPRSPPATRSSSSRRLSRR